MSTWQCLQCKSKDGDLVEEKYTICETGQSLVLTYMLCNKCKRKDFLRDYQVTIELSDVTMYSDVHNVKKWAGKIEVDI